MTSRNPTLCLHTGTQKAWQTALFCGPRPIQQGGFVELSRGLSSRYRSAGLYLIACVIACD